MARRTDDEPDVSAPISIAAHADSSPETSVAAMLADLGRSARSAPLQFEGAGTSVGADADREHESLCRERAELGYLLCRSLRARRVVAFGCAVSAIVQLAAAMRDNGGGIVVAVATDSRAITFAHAALQAAGIAGFVEFRHHDARSALGDLGGDVDFAVIDTIGAGEACLNGIDVMRIVAPQMQGGAIALLGDIGPEPIAWMRTPVNGFRSMRLPLAGATELSVKA